MLQDVEMVSSLDTFKGGLDKIIDKNPSHVTSHDNYCICNQVLEIVYF